MRQSFFAVLSLCLFLASPALAEREISGQISVLERMALPDDTMILVDLVDADDRVVASARRATEGQQSPFDFALTGPAESLLVLRVGLRGMEDGFWLSEPLGIAPGTGDMDVGSLRAIRTPLMGFASLLACGDQYIEIGFLPDEVRLRLNEQLITMQSRPAASGAYFEAPDNPATSVHLKEDSAILRIDGAELSECRLIRPEIDITQGVWNISAIGDSPTVFPSRTELVFYPDGRVTASVGCNRMVGNYRRHGGVLTFGRIASTMMGCPDEVAAQERRFAEALVRIDGYRLDPENRRLRLTAAGETVLQARK